MWKTRWSLLVGVSGAVAYTIVLGWILSQRYWAFQTFAWDLGNFNQGMWTALFNGRPFFYYSADTPSGNVGSLLSSHFSPILYLLLPFYALDPGPPALLVIQSAGLAVGTIPLYFLARRLGLPNSWTLLVEAAYLSTPVLMGIGWYDFHAEAFLPATVLFTVYCYYFARRWVFVASWFLCLSVIETVSPLLFLFALGGIVALLYDRHRGTPQPRELWIRTTVGAFAALAWLGFAELFNVTVNHGGLGTLGAGYSSAFSTLGPNLSFFAVVPYAIVHPASAASAISTEGGAKLAYVVVLLGSMAFLPLLGPKRLLLPFAGWILLISLSNGGTLIQFGVQNAAYGFSFLAPGVPFGLARLRSKWLARTVSRPRASSAGHRPWSRATVFPLAAASSIVVGIVVSTALVSPLQADPMWSFDGVDHGLPTLSYHDELLHQVVAMIPSSAAVLTVSPIFPEVSSRLHAYVDPISSSFQPNLTFVAALDNYVNSSQYVLVDYYVAWFDSSVLVHFANLSAFGIMAEENQIVLFEKGWTGPPQLWVPLQLTWCGDQLGTTRWSYADPANGTACGAALTSYPGAPVNSLLWYGPYFYGLVPGTYTLEVWLSAQARTIGPQLRVDSISYPLNLVVHQTGATTDQHSYGFSFLPTGSQRTLGSSYLSNPSPGPKEVTANLTITFAWNGLSGWGIAGWVYSQGATVHLLAVEVQQLSL